MPRRSTSRVSERLAQEGRFNLTNPQLVRVYDERHQAWFMFERPQGQVIFQTEGHRAGCIVTKRVHDNEFTYRDMNEATCDYSLLVRGASIGSEPIVLTPADFIYICRNAHMWLADIARLLGRTANAVSATYNRYCEARQEIPYVSETQRTRRTTPASSSRNSERVRRSADWVNELNAEEIPEWATSFTPWTTVGVEIESLRSGIANSHRFVSQAVACHHSTHYRHDQTRDGAGDSTKFTHWKVVPDASIRSGAETVSPIMRENAFMEIRRVCTALKQAGASTGQSAGVHIHLGVDHLPYPTLGRIIDRHTQFKFVWRALTRESRWENGMCMDRPTHRGAVLAEQWRLGNTTPDSRYNALGCETSWQKYGTFELRKLHSTLNPKFIAAWIALHDEFFRICHAESEGVTEHEGTYANLLGDLPQNIEEAKQTLTRWIESGLMNIHPELAQVLLADRSEYINRRSA